MARDGEENLGRCPICGREMVPGPSVDRHHWVPKSEGGGDWSWLHTVCHRKIHAVLDERALATRFRTADSLLELEEIRRFVAWVRRKPPEFLDWHRRPRRR